MATMEMPDKVCRRLFMSSDNPPTTARRKHRIRNAGRGQISIKGTTHAKLKIVSEGLNKSMGQIVEEQVNEYLDRVGAPPPPRR